QLTLCPKLRICRYCRKRWTGSDVAGLPRSRPPRGGPTSPHGNPFCAALGSSGKGPLRKAGNVVDPTDLYRLDGSLPELTDPVLLYHFEGFVDAGATGRLAIGHLLAELEHRVIARFDVDRLLDYRSRRPVMIFDTDRWTDYETPELAVHLVHDTTGTPFLIMSGPEPDREWELFTDAVATLVTRLSVSKLVSVHGIPMGVPHT